MIPDKVIYTDGRDVVVTDSTFKVKNTSYKLNGITKLCMWTIRPDRWPAVLLMFLGIAAAVCGYMGVLPDQWVFDFQGRTYTADTIGLWLGGFLFVLGLLILAVTKERYAVRIATAEGEKNALVSTRRDYVSQIVDAIHSAFDLNHNEMTMKREV